MRKMASKFNLVKENGSKNPNPVLHISDETLHVQKMTDGIQDTDIHVCSVPIVVEIS